MQTCVDVISQNFLVWNSEYRSGGGDSYVMYRQFFKSNDTPCEHPVSEHESPSSDIVNVNAKLSLYLTKYPPWRRIHCLIKHHAMMACLRSGVLASCILNLGTRWRWVVSFTLWPLYPRYPLDWRLCGLQSRSGRDDEEKNIPAPVGDRTPVVQLVA
jgi:hypothetical protein